MKIEIEFTNSYEADLLIDGRKLKYGYKHGMWQFFEGLEDDEVDATIGGIVACKLTSPLIDILQGWIPEELVHQPSSSSVCWR